jgi:uncharacterized protein
MVEAWRLIKECKTVPKLNNPVLIEGLPGIGNVGKIAIDFIIEELKAKKLYTMFSYTLPHSVFVNEDNLVELPSIEIYYKKFNGKKRDLLILTGDVQPTEEVSSYSFCDKLLEVAKNFKIDEIITTGGIGLKEIPENPKIFITGNDKEMIMKYAKKSKIETDIHGVVGPIVGVSGLLLGLSKMKNISGVALLAETFGHPMYLGVKGARGILNVLNNQFGFDLDLEKLTKEILQLEKETIKRTKELRDMKHAMKGNSNEETTYIG